MLGSQLDDELNGVHFSGATLDHIVHVEHELVELGKGDVELIVPVDLLPLVAVVRVSHETEHVDELGQDEEWKAQEQEYDQAIAVVCTLVA